MVTEKTHYWEKYGFFGGHRFLDFTNTVDDVEKTRELEAIEDWSVMLSWAFAAKLINKSEMAVLTNAFSIEETQSELDNLHKLRELAWHVLSAIAADTLPKSSDLSALSDEVRWAYSQATLISVGKSLSWDNQVQAPNLTLIRARIGLAADDLFRKNPLKIIECGSCTGLFLNQGRGVGRKWCRMQSCGNRAKINKFRTR